jgi:hypothetical protein
MTRGGLPHSEIPGSKLICSSPGLIAACHVLHRLLAPRHSPYTLSSLTIRNSELTITNCLHVSWSASVLCNTACPTIRLPSHLAMLRRDISGMNVVVGKNYRLQNIQLSKITPGGFSPRPPLAHSPAPKGPAPLATAKSPFATLKSRNRLRPRLVGAPQERRAAGRSRQQPSDGRRRGETRQPHSHAATFSKIPPKTCRGRAVRVIALLSVARLRWLVNRSSSFSPCQPKLVLFPACQPKLV